MDFGLAKLQEPETPRSGTSSTLSIAPSEDGAMLGTLPYMSPEQVQGKRADARTDLFALGVMLYEMVTGVRPFRADNRAALIAAILTGTPPPASRLSSASLYLDRVLERSLEKDPDRRWQSARDFASALQWARDGERSAADGSEHDYRSGMRLRKPVVWSAAAIAGSALALSLAFFAHDLDLRQITPDAQRVGLDPGGGIAQTRIIVAVLPVRHLANNAEQEYLSEGLTEEMIAHLGNVNPARLGVISRTSAMHYKDSTKRADQIGQELGARYLLEASLQQVGDRVRVTTELIEAETQAHVWSEQFDRDTRDILALQRDVALAVTERTTSSLGVVADASRLAARRHSSNSMAYEHYLLGRHHLVRDASDDLVKAREHFEAAIRLDDTYALAHSGLAETYALLGSYDIMPIGTSHPLGRKAAERAVQLDDNLAEAHRALAQILADHYWEWEQAEKHHRRALSLAPEDATTLRAYSFYMAYTGRAIEAIPMAEKARRLDPVSPNARMNLGVTLQFAGRFDEAIRELEATLDLDPGFGFARAVLALTYLGKGLPERAVIEAAKARELDGRRPDIISVQGHVLARAGHTREALKALDDLKSLPGREPSPWGVANIYIGLDDHDRAFEWLDKAVAARVWELPILKHLPPTSVSEKLRSDPRFTAVLARIGLPW
jgi:TolB-like protein/Tfp pilus assembly protein PilF